MKYSRDYRDTLPWLKFGQNGHGHPEGYRTAPMLLRFDHLHPIGKCGHSFDRSVSWVQNRPLVVFHKRGRALAPKARLDWPSLLQQFDSDPVVELERSSWSWTRARRTDFNCHSLAIGSHVGLGHGDWLEGASSEATLADNPAGILLENCFARLDDAGAKGADTEAPRENDVLVYYNSQNDQFVHSVLLKRINDRLLAISKFGEGPILITSNRLVERFFAGQFDELRCYRPLGLKKSDHVPIPS